MSTAIIVHESLPISKINKEWK